METLMSAYRKLAIILVVGVLTTFAVAETVLAPPAIEKRRSQVVIAVEKASPSVVNINTVMIVNRLVDPFSRGLFSSPLRMRKRVPVQSLGSGVVVHKDGFIATNAHVVKDAEVIRVSFLDGREYDAKVIYSNKNEELALIKIESPTEEFKAITIAGSDDLMMGETVVAVGNPFGFQHSVSTGVVSALNRSIKSKLETEISEVIQTDAAINQGNSGGPLLNICGDLIGINTSIVTPSGGSAGLGFAIPSSRVVRMIDRILYNVISLEEQMGIVGVTNIETLANRYHVPNTGGKGVLVVEMNPEGYAYKSGIRAGDVIVDINGQVIDDQKAYRSAIESVSGNRIEAIIHRLDKQGNRYQNKTYKVGFNFSAKGIKDAESDAKATLDLKPEPLNWLALGLRVVELDQSWKSALSLTDQSGVVVQRVMENMPATDSIKVGDLIYKIGKVKIATLADFKKAMKRYDRGSRIRFYLWRGGKEMKVSLFK
jgi:S1-C subfamily serine protease